MTATLVQPATSPAPAPQPTGRGRRGWGTPLGLGIAGLWLSVIVLLPLAAIAAKSFGDGAADFWDTITSPSAIASFKVTILVSVAVTVVNVFFGLIIAWVLVRDEFPGKKIVNALIDLPFALPTIVASIVLLALYGPASPIGVHLQFTRWGLGVALLFVTLPFVVRAVQPVLIELERDVEEAAASLGASNTLIFRKIVLPSLLPALLSGAGLAFSRAIGEFGSVILIGGGIPRKTEVSSQLIKSLIEQDNPEGAAAISVVLLVISFVILFVLRSIAARGAKREALDA